jgi:hypothetical protein
MTKWQDTMINARQATGYKYFEFVELDKDPLSATLYIKLNRYIILHEVKLLLYPLVSLFAPM